MDTLQYRELNLLLSGPAKLHRAGDHPEKDPPEQPPANKAAYTNGGLGYTANSEEQLRHLHPLQKGDIGGGDSETSSSSGDTITVTPGRLAPQVSP